MYFSKVLFSLCLLMAFMGDNVFAQSSSYAGVEVQGYPAGIIVGPRAGINLSTQQELNLRLGYNFTDRRDFGKHDNEEGGGPGFGIGYRYLFDGKLDGFVVGIRTDFWFMKIDWKDGRTVCGTVPPCFEQQVNGQTDIIVFQPTAEAGYDILRNNTAWSLIPTISLGVEMNIRTEGEEVGEGAILLGGLNISYNF